MPKREAELKSQFFKELRRQLPSFLTLSLATAGAPDRAIVGNECTSFLEFKHATPDFISHGNQELFCMRLAVQSYCRYVVWWEAGEKQFTMLVHPKQIHERTGWTLSAEKWCPGFDHKWLVQEIKGVHQCK